MRFGILLCLIAGAAFAQTAEMYRTVSIDGTVTFSDLPLGENSEPITVLVRSGATTSNANSASARADNADDAALSETQVAQMAEDCQRAREQLASLETTTSLYRVLPSGERQFLSDEEVAAAQQDARSKIAEWCQ